MNDMQVMELATRVCHARRINDAARLVQRSITGKGNG
jgi:hypothetical protein